MVDERESLPAGKLQANTKFSSNSLKIILKYQSIEVVQLYETEGGNGKMLFITLLFPFLKQFLKIPLLYFHLPFPYSTFMFSQETAGL